MFRSTVLFFAVGTINALYLDAIHRHINTRSIFPRRKIVGGKPVKIDQVPWQVALEDRGFLFCGGSIISANYILTAAQCTDGSAPEHITVRYSTDELETGGNTTEVAEIFQNNQYDFFSSDYDVSVLKLAAPIILSASATTISLRSIEAPSGGIATVSGWGALSIWVGVQSETLQAVNVSVVFRDDCKASYGDDFTDRMICAGDASKDFCVWDFGGALTFEGAQVGIVSWGYGCAKAGYPGVYSNVAAVADFIKTSSDNEATWV